MLQAPTPPTKPIPPTPPNMKTSSGTHSTDTPSPTTVTPQVSSPAKEQQAPPSNVLSQSTSNIPPMTTSDTSKETTSETAISPVVQIPKTSSSSFSFNFIFVFILFAALALIAVHWWKNSKGKQQSSVDYSTESSDEIVNLILSQNNPEPLQAVPKILPKKITSKTESISKTKGGFEVRI